MSGGASSRPKLWRIKGRHWLATSVLGLLWVFIAAIVGLSVLRP